MTTSFYYSQVDKNQKNSRLLECLSVLAETTNKQIYVLDRPLGDSKYSYEYEEAFVVLAPNHRMLFVNAGQDSASFDEYVADFIEDLASISDKFRYKDYIGRPRHWKENLVETIHVDEIEDVSTLLQDIALSDPLQKRNCELLISLLTGSINDIEKVKGVVPDNLLDRIKRKIILFDGDQTRFVYQRPAEKRVTIQGLSGTGKTELLLHKLKEIYVENPESKVIFTCHNRILADSLRGRIPEFFDFMKVEEQIKWNERLWCVNAWGSFQKKDSGAYSYICDFYGLSFYRYSPGMSFDQACKIAIEELSKYENSEYAFDYMLIDESQDFPASFFELCELVTKNTVYVAGDIFQSIFDENVITEIQPDFLLSKCYRTDPKTLMFAHAMGMGLFETPKLRWLEENEWRACGYIVNMQSDSTYELSREPLRRFEDLEQEGYSSIELVNTSVELGDNSESKILEILQNIIDENPTVLPDDIGVIFIDNTKNTYATADRLEQSIPRTFGWEVNKAYESKEKVKGTLFVSNKNNVKGLEFPFVICVTKKIHSSRSYRNALYMMLTRSFLRTYLLISKDSNEDLLEQIQSGLEVIQKRGVLKVTPPTDEEKQSIITAIKYPEDNVSFYDFVDGIFDEIGVLNIFRPTLHDIVNKTLGERFDREKVYEVAEFNYKRMETNER